MKTFSAKHKIIILGLIWLGVSAAMFFYFFPILDDQNQTALTALAKDQKDLAVLQAQNKSYIQAQADLKALAQQPIQPENFFSRDITLVNEIRTLEALSQKLGVQMQLSGISGTVDLAPKAATASSLAAIPYGLTLSGDFVRVVDFIETLEHLSFISNVSSLSMTAGGGNSVTAGLTASLYLRK